MKRISTAWVFGILSCHTLSSAEPVSFRSHVAPILLENCTSCHGPKKAEGGYRLDSFAQLQKAGDSGVQPLAVQDGKHMELLRAW